MVFDNLAHTCALNVRQKRSRKSLLYERGCAMLSPALHNGRRLATPPERGLAYAAYDNLDYAKADVTVDCKKQKPPLCQVTDSAYIAM